MKNIDKLKKIKYIKSRKEGKSICQSLKDAGYADTSAEGKNSALSIVKVCDKEIEEEFRLSDLSADMVIKKLHSLYDLAEKKRDYSTCRGILELMGKFLAIWKDKQEITQDIDITQRQAINTLITNRLKGIEEEIKLT